MDLNLKDKVALVTGGSRGLGKAICLSLAAEGAKIAVSYYRNVDDGVDLADEATELVKEIADTYGAQALAVGGDVSVEADVLDMFGQVAKKFPQIDILVNNAAVCPTCWVPDMPLEMWSRTICESDRYVFNQSPVC
jgi:3-oxoacyl-[acyl-carrier protein] reductase